jgi:predicted nucleic acid-binding protein
VADTWVVNASPLIALDRIDHIHVLSRLARVVVPVAVLSEIQRGPRPLDPSTLGQHTVGEVAGVDPRVAAWDLGEGESEVLCCALAESAIAVLDDRAARRCACAERCECSWTRRGLASCRLLVR